MKSQLATVGEVELPYVNAEISMIPFNLKTLEGVPHEYLNLVKEMVAKVKNRFGTAYFTIHGKTLKAGQTLRRPCPHIDGNYKPVVMSFGGGGWKIGEDGPAINTEFHRTQYLNPNGGIIMTTNYASCLGWVGEYEGTPNVGGDCRHIELDDPVLLEAGKIYYGNNHFIHESIPVSRDIHRVFARITLPTEHEYGVLS